MLIYLFIVFSTSHITINACNGTVRKTRQSSKA